MKMAEIAIGPKVNNFVEIYVNIHQIHENFVLYVKSKKLAKNHSWEDEEKMGRK